MATTTYYWDELSDNVIMEEDQNRAVVAEYGQEPRVYGELISQKRGADTSYYHFDAQGSTRTMTDESENITGTYDYTAFGEELAQTSTTENPFGYIGALGYYSNSEADDVYVRARTYQPTLGRWESRDPLANNVINRNTGESYTYVGNRPLVAVDPSGLVSIIPVAKGRVNKCVNSKLVYEWDFFRTPWPGYACAGWFVQRVDIWCERRKCPCKAPPWPNDPGPPTATYWEAWEVLKGQREYYGRKDDGFTDVFEVGGGEGCGFVIKKGVVKFYCNEDLPINIKDRKDKWMPGKIGPRLGVTVFACGEEHGTKDQHSTRFYGDASWFELEWFYKPREGPAEHGLGRHWQCCSCEEKFDDAKEWWPPGSGYIPPKYVHILR